MVYEGSHATSKHSSVAVGINLFQSCILYKLAWDSVVGIATCYGLDGPGIQPQRGRDFPHPSRMVLGSTQSPIQWLLGLSQG
jgi:hypothetical protein